MFLQKYQQRLRRLLALGLLSLFIALPVFAQSNTSLIPKTDPAGCTGLVNKITSPNSASQFELYDIPCYATYLIEVLVYFAGGIAILFVVIGGYQYMLGGVTEDKEAGKKTLLYAIGGFALVVLAWTIVNIVQVFLTS